MVEIDGEPKSSPGAQEPGPQLSKNAIKRQLKRQRWEDSREERRAYKKAKLREKKEVLKLSGQKPNKQRKVVVEGQKSSCIRVVIDCAFDDLMIDKVSRSSCATALTLGNN